MIPPKLRALVKEERAENCCERCGDPLDPFYYSLQHRRARQMGGTKRPDTASNLAALCGSATTGCHQWVESHPDAAILDGWRVPSWDDPALVPIRHWELGLVYLAGDGRYTDVPEVAA